MKRIPTRMRMAEIRIFMLAYFSFLVASGSDGMSPLTDADEGKDRIVDDIDVIGIDPFADQGGAVVGHDLADAQDLHEDQVDITLLAHLAPGFPVIVVLVLHNGTRP